MIANLLYRIGLITFVTITNVIIAFVCASEAMWLCLMNGWSKHVSLGFSILIAILVTLYIRFNYIILFKIRNGEMK